MSNSNRSRPERIRFLLLLTSRANVVNDRLRLSEEARILRDRRRARRPRRRFSKTKSPTDHLRDLAERARIASRTEAGEGAGRGGSREDTTTRKTVRFWRYNATMLIIAAALPMPWRALAIDSKWPPPPLRNRMHASVTHNSPY